MVNITDMPKRNKFYAESDTLTMQELIDDKYSLI